MGCDIHSRAERRVNGKWEIISPGWQPFDWRSYGMFGFLANVRNYSAVPSISEPRGLPDDIADDGDDNYLGDHSFSWLSVAELLAFDYDQQVEDRRVTRQLTANMWSGAETADQGQGRLTTWRDFLGHDFFADLAKLQDLGAERIVFGFDS
jgi:hypothetical protein